MAGTTQPLSLPTSSDRLLLALLVVHPHVYETRTWPRRAERESAGEEEGVQKGQKTGTSQQEWALRNDTAQSAPVPEPPSATP